MIEAYISGFIYTEHPPDFLDEYDDVPEGGFYLKAMSSDGKTEGIARSVDIEYMLSKIKITWLPTEEFRRINLAPRSE